MRRVLVHFALLLLLAPLAFAHDPAGTPKNYCEPMSEWAIHDYVSLEGTMAGFPTDGNVGGDCDAQSGLGDPCVGFHDPNNPFAGIYVGLCDFNSPFGDWDGHNEFAYGGASILAGAIAIECFGASPHHTEFGTFTTDDLALVAGATVDVAADTVDATGLNNPCGDFETDVSESFVGGGTVTIPAGLDGSYSVYVTGTAGHIYWP